MPSLDQEFAQYQGQSVLVPGASEADRGQCVQWADFVLHDVCGLPYVYANAIDWWNLPGSLANNFDRITDGSIKKGDFVIWNQKVGSVYGHIDVAMQDGNINNFVASDTNWAGNKTVHLVNHVNQAGYIIGTLRRKGGSVSADALTSQQVTTLHYAYTLRAPGPVFVQSYTGKTLDQVTAALDGKVNPLRAEIDKMYADVVKIKKDTPGIQ